MFRISCVLPGAVTAVLCAVGVAQAAPVQDFDITAKPSKVSTPSKPKSVTLRFRTGTRETDAGVQPPITAAAAIFFPAGARWNGHLFPSCSGPSISAAKSTAECPPRSIIGRGKAAGIAPGPVTQNDLTIVALNGGRNRVNLFVEGSSPLRIQSNLEGRISPASAPYGLKLAVDIPQNLQEPAPGVPIAITNFEVQVGASIRRKGVTRGLMEIYRCTGSWRAQGRFSYRGGTTVRVDDRMACTK